MKCPRCKCENIQISFIEQGSKTKKSGIGLGGHAHNAVRGVVGLGTLGVSNLVIKKRTGDEKSKTKSVKMAVCQGCGHSWKV